MPDVGSSEAVPSLSFAGETTTSEYVRGFVELTEGGTKTLVTGPMRSTVIGAGSIGTPSGVTFEDSALAGEVAFEGPMADLKDLLDRHRVAYAILEVATEPPPQERRAWMAISLGSLLAGINCGLAIAVDGYWLDPATGLFSALGFAVLAATAATHSKRVGRLPR